MRPSSAHSRGFTLIEVLISVAIVLILVAGINLIFGIASNAVGAGQALNDNARANQAAQGVMFNDFQNCATDDSPYLIISSHAVAAFRNIEDMRSDPDFNPADTNPDTRGQGILKIDLDRDGTVGNSPGEITSPVTINNRNHRTDVVEFFSRGRNLRRTGNPKTYVATGSSDESLVWYGHLALPDNAGTFLAGGVPKTAPGQGTFGNNPNNIFSSQWIVGRESILLKSADAAPSDFIFDSGGTAAVNRQNHLYDSAYWSPNNAAAPATLWPLSTNAPAKIDNGPSDSAGQETIQYGRYDIADTNFDLFRKRLQRFITGPPVPANWWSRLMADDSIRFYADPLIAKPLTSAEFAKTSPVFLNACSQFIVEFAGDFVTQDVVNSDQVTANSGDGTIDFFNKYVAPGLPTTPPIRQIRWYGFPRNTETFNDLPGGQFIPGTRVPNAPFYSGTIDSRIDVVPVRDVTTTGNVVMPFERVDPADNHNILIETAAGAPANWETAAGVTPNSNYVCAWGPDTDAAGVHRPSLIRITYTLDDPSGRISEGSTFEYVFKIK